MGWDIGGSGTSTASIAKFADSTTPLGGSATFNGTTRDTTLGSGFYTWFRASASADQNGTLNIQVSDDGATWYIVNTVQVAAGNPNATTIEAAIGTFKFARVQYVNGAAAQGSFKCTSALIP